VNFTPLLTPAERPKNQPLFYCFLQYRDIDSYRKLKRAHKTHLVRDFLESFCLVADLDFQKVRYDGPEKMRQRRPYEIIFDIFDVGIPKDQLFRFHFGLSNYWNYIFHWDSYKSWKQVFDTFERPEGMLEDLRGRYLHATWSRFHQPGRHSSRYFYDIYKFMNIPKRVDGGLDPEFTGSGYADLHPNPDLLPDFWKFYKPWGPDTKSSGMWKETPQHQVPQSYKGYHFAEDNEEILPFSESRINF